MADILELTPLTKEQWQETIMGAAANAFQREERAGVEKVAAYVAALEAALIQAIRDFKFIVVESTDPVIVEAAVDIRRELMQIFLNHHPI